jgi:NAD(P)-dependent dehydrogenase (short-subunit alcohol dehydrogenase family)
MSEKKVWLVTGAGRGLGVDIAKAALAAGHAVVATGRDAAKVAAAVGDHDNLLAVALDVTRAQDAQAAVEAAVAKFSRLDVLVNNAGNFFAGFFEELSPEQVRDQIETLLFGPMNVTRAVLPVMRTQRSGLVVTISSTAGITGQLFCTAYAAAKFGIEGWMESLTPEIAPFGIRTMLVEPGFFRTELLTTGSTTYAHPTIADYAAQTREIVAVEEHGWEARWRSRQARDRPCATRRTQGAPDPIRGGCRRRTSVRGQGPDAARPGSRPSRIVDIPGVRRRLSSA